MHYQASIRKKPMVQWYIISISLSSYMIQTVSKHAALYIMCWIVAQNGLHVNTCLYTKSSCLDFWHVVALSVHNMPHSKNAESPWWKRHLKQQDKNVAWILLIFWLLYRDCCSCSLTKIFRILIRWLYGRLCYLDCECRRDSTQFYTKL